MRDGEWTRWRRLEAAARRRRAGLPPPSYRAMQRRDEEEGAEDDETLALVRRVRGHAADVDVTVSNPGGGDCLYYALADALPVERFGRDTGRAHRVRRHVAVHSAAQGTTVGHPGEWGTERELQACATALRRCVLLNVPKDPHFRWYAIVAESLPGTLADVAEADCLVLRLDGGRIGDFVGLHFEAAAF